MNYMFFLINIPWALIFLIILIAALCIKFYIDTKDLKSLTYIFENSKYNDSVAIRHYKEYIKRHPLSIYNDMIRTLMIPPSISVLSDEARKKLIKNNYLYFIPEQLNDFIIFCCFILKENQLNDEYNTLISRIAVSKNKKFLCDKIQYILSSNIDDTTSEINDASILKGILYFNTVEKNQNISQEQKTEYLKKSYELCHLYPMKDLIIKRGGKIE